MIVLLLRFVFWVIVYMGCTKTFAVESAAMIFKIKRDNVYHFTNEYMQSSEGLPKEKEVKSVVVVVICLRPITV